MADKSTHSQDSMVLMGTFQDLDRAVEALDQLREVGLSDDDITVLSSVPLSHKILGRPHKLPKLPFISLIFAGLGLLVGVFYTTISPNLYVIRVGGQPIVPAPPTAVLLYEFAMLFLVVGTFIGMLWLNGFPALGPEYYDAKLTDGRIGLILHCLPDKHQAAQGILLQQGAENVHHPERRPL